MAQVGVSKAKAPRRTRKLIHKPPGVWGLSQLWDLQNLVQSIDPIVKQHLKIKLVDAPYWLKSRCEREQKVWGVFTKSLTQMIKVVGNTEGWE